MANKKCPKCGEDNPAEAVMCWACYTPLTAGAGASMTAGMGGAGAATMPRPGGPVGVPGVGANAGADDTKKKEIDPKIFLLGGLLAVGGIVALFTSGVLGGKTPDALPDLGVTTDTNISGSTSSGTSSSTSSAPALGPAVGNAPSSSGNSGQTTGPPPPPYSIVSSPNPTLSTATFGIVSAQPITSEAQALSLAKMARQQQGSSNPKWTKMQIVVFSDTASGAAFKQYENGRKGAPLGRNDFANLAGLGAWNGATVYYETQGTAGKIAYPSKNPKGWWGGG